MTDMGGQEEFVVRKVKNEPQYKVWYNQYYGSAGKIPSRKTGNEKGEYRITDEYEGEVVDTYNTRKEAEARAKQLNNGIPAKYKYIKNVEVDPVTILIKKIKKLKLETFIKKQKNPYYVNKYNTLNNTLDKIYQKKNYKNRERDIINLTSLIEEFTEIIGEQEPKTVIMRKKKPPPPRPAPAAAEEPAIAAVKELEAPNKAPKSNLSIRKKRNENYYNIFKGDKIIYSFDTKAAAIAAVKKLEAPAQEPKKESKPKKPKIAKPTKLQFVEGFQKLPRDEQIEILIKQLENYEPMPYTKTKELFNDLPKLLSMSPSKALPQILKYGITPDELRILYKSKVFDFFPTPNSCLDKLFKQLPSAYKKHSTMLEGTAGLGNVSYYFYNKGWDVTSNEYDPQLFKIMSRLLPKKILKTNDDFFKLKYVDVDTLFLNPPFAKHIWVKFLLAGIKLLKNSTTRAQIRNLMFISPAMNNAKDEKYLDWEYIVKPNGNVPRSAFKKYVEELLGHKVDVEKILAGEDEEFDENFKIFFGTQFDLCSGFGGTGMKAALSFFQVE
jgi:hypothetical protein